MATLPERKSPAGKRVSLFATCMVDMIYPQTGMAVVDVLEHLGVQVDFPQAQTCCGQPGFNAGYQDEAKEVAKQFLRAFHESEVIVAPSGSCVAMIRHEYPTLFADDPKWLPHAQDAAAKTWEITEFIVNGLGITDLNARLPQPQSIAMHDACHGLRLLGLGDSARTLLNNVENLTLEDLPDADKCCGFGGLFSVKMAGVSNAMLQKKMACINECPASHIVTGDVSCMTHMNGGLSRTQSASKVSHVMDLLAEGVRHAKSQTAGDQNDSETIPADYSI
ncbi:MAG: (Fe-S)-binding protein [Chloroflexota bacterium]